MTQYNGMTSFMYDQNGSDEFNAAAWLQKNNHPVNQQTVNKVLATWKKQREKQREEQQRQAVQPSYEVVPPHLPPRQPDKIEEKTITTINLDKQRQLELIMYATLIIGTGVGLYMWHREGSVLAGVAYGAMAAGVIAITVMGILLLMAERNNNNAVSRVQAQENAKTERERIKAHKEVELERLRLARAQAEHAAEQTRQRREYQQQQRQQLTQRGMAVHQRTYSETSIVATENTMAYGQPFDDEVMDEVMDDAIDVEFQPAETTAIEPVSSVLQPRINDSRELFLDWLATIHSHRAWNDSGRITPSKCKTKVTAPWSKRSKATPTQKAEIKAYLDNQRGSETWLIRPVENGYMLNLSMIEDYAELHEYVVNTW